VRATIGPTQEGATVSKTKMTQERWNELTEHPITASAIIFLIAYAWDVLGDHTGFADAITETIMWIVWVVFVVDYVVNLVLAPQRLKWFFTHFYEFLIVVLPLLRPLRLLRLVTLFVVLQRIAGVRLRGRLAIYIVGSSLLLLFIASLAILDAERHADGASITTWWDAIWWSFVTFLTVGYGDFTPVTLDGRLVAIGLMVAGLSLLGIVTATLAGWLVEKVADNEKREERLTAAHIDEILDEMRALRAEVAELKQDRTDEATPAATRQSDEMPAPPAERTAHR
jgi:voltage-gated potassium channel